MSKPGQELERLAAAAYLAGRDAESLDLLTAAHSAFLAEHDPPRAARAAFWLAFIFTHQRETARAAGWLARAQRLLDEHGRDCVERAYVLVPEALRHVRGGNIEAAEAAFADAARIGEGFDDADIVCLARAGQGRTLIALGKRDRGIALLDEVMVSVTSGELSPIVAGTIYCSVISACFELFDLRRAQEWTDALNRWCASRPDLVPYRGECLVHRAELMLLHGIWSDAAEQARQACEWLGRPSPQPALGTAFYQLAEAHRLRGEFAQAAEAYRRANDAGKSPHPGLALLRLAQGKVETARAAIAGALQEPGDRRARAATLAGAIEVLLAAGDVAQARAAADELVSIAAALDVPWLAAASGSATGAVLLAEGDPRAALVRLRAACGTWRELDAPYEAARTGALIARAYRQLGDADTARLEQAAAARVFRELGAAADLAAADAPGATSGGPEKLSPREIEVLKLLSSGKTNRQIAAELGISDKTVARHVSNIFTKLDLPSRAAATAYAFRHKLV